MADKKKTAARKKKAPKQKWRWLFLKFLLLVACLGLAGFLGLVTFLNGEAQRLGIFEKVGGQDSAQVEQAVAQQAVPAAPAASSEDYTTDEKQQLEAILESQDGQ
jgi:hypothetical protein